MECDDHQREHDPERLKWVTSYGADAVSFQSLTAGLRWWSDPAAGENIRAALAYLPAGGSWIAVGSPLCPEHRRTSAVRAFAAAARAAGRRPVFFAVEDVRPFAGCRTLLLGEQPVLTRASWDAARARSRSLREQLRRARAKGVTIRRVRAEELRPGRSLARDAERLGVEWLGCRGMEPMGFLVAVEPFHAPAEHIYLVAEFSGEPVLFVNAVPIHARHGWFLEDVLRSRRAPNGTTELAIDALLRALGDGEWLTPGLTPLSGAIPAWLRVTRFVTRPLYDFTGLRRFRDRLSPHEWRPVWLAWDRGPAPLVLLDVLQAFARRRIVAFAWRSLVWHPNGLPWLVAVPLVPWIALLGGMVAAGAAPLLAWSPRALAAWGALDVGILWMLWRAARRPVPWRLGVVLLLAAVDAGASVRHLVRVGLGSSALSTVLRLAAVGGPLIATGALSWALALSVAAGRRAALRTRRSRDGVAPSAASA